MSNKYIDAAKTIAQGALEAMTFGAYHQFTTNKIMDLNNQYMDLKHKHDIDTINQKHQREIKHLHNELNELKQAIAKLNSGSL